MKTISKISLIAALLASGITAASAQSTTRGAYDQPNYYGPGPMSGPAYPGVGGWNDPTGYRSGFSNTNLFATPGSQEERDISNQGG